MFKRFWLFLVIVPPCTLVAGVLIAAVVTYIMPKKYESFAVVEVRPGMELNLATEKERLTSAAFLEKVFHELDLGMRWGVDLQTAIRQQREYIRVEQIRGTDLLHIRARHPNREDARDLVASLCSVYIIKLRSEWEESAGSKQAREMIEAVREQEETVEELRRRASDTPSQITDPASTAIHEELKRETERLQEMRMKMLGEVLVMPIYGDNYNGIIVHDDPIIADAPISPNVALNLGVGAISGLLFGFPLALAIMALLHRLRPAHP